MLRFLKERSYDIVKLLINQIAISIFGFSLAFATAGHTALRVGTSIFSILFYLFIIYIMMWDLGAKDSHKIERQESGYSRAAGLYMALFASLPNFIIAILIMLGNLIPAMGNVGGVASFIALFTEGMYMGLLLTLAGMVGNFGAFWFAFFLTPLPLIFTAFIAYFAGSRNFRVFGGKR